MPWQQSRESLQRGEKQMLARIVEEMSGIENAAVQYDEIRHPGFPPRVESRAMVAVKAVGVAALGSRGGRSDPRYRRGVQERFGTRARHHHRPERLPRLSGRPSPRFLACAARTLAAAKRVVEDEWRTKIEERLHMYPDLTVSINAHFAEMPIAPTPTRVPSEGNVRSDASGPGGGLDRCAEALFRRRLAPTSRLRGTRGTSGRTDSRDRTGCLRHDRSSRVGHVAAPAPGWQTPHQVTVTSHDELLADPWPDRPRRVVDGVGLACWHRVPASFLPRPLPRLAASAAARALRRTRRTVPPSRWRSSALNRRHPSPSFSSSWRRWSSATRRRRPRS
jgi:hypothetical protein